MRRLNQVVCGLLVLALAGCASTRGANYTPLIDTKGVDTNAMAGDLTDCQGFARDRINSRQRAIAGAIVGALLGAAIAPRGYRNDTAGYGAAFGAAGAGGQAVETQEVIIQRCMAGRGYIVLN